MCRHTIFRSYCRYYNRHAISVTTEVTTVATENRMTTHAIFFLIYGCPMSGAVFKKKLSFKDDSDDAKVHAAFPHAKERWAKNDDECTFLRICHHHCNSNSQNLLRVWGPLASEPFKTVCLSGYGSTLWWWFQGNANVATKIVHNSALSVRL